MKYWGFENKSWVDKYPVGKAVEKMIQDFSEYSVYLRKDQRIKCPCCYDQATASYEYDPLFTDAPDRPYCPECYGFGVQVTPQIISCRLSRGDSKITAREKDIRFEPGYVDKFLITADVPRNVYPKLEDYILTVEWNVPSQQVTGPKKPEVVRIYRVYLIKQVNDNYERQLSWYGLGLETFSISDDWFRMVTPLFNDLPIIKPDPIYTKKFW